MSFTNSPLIDYTRISPNKTVSRNHEIDTISIHCYVGQAKVESMADWLCNPKAQASSNYGIDTNGRIGMFVEEKDRSWCTSSPSNDNRAITIECACDKTAPFAVNDKVYRSLILLLADICKRNNIKELKWKGDKTLIGQVDKQNMTVHKWFKNKDCPGEYLYSRHGQIAAEVNAILSGASEPDIKPEEMLTFPSTPFTVDVIVDDLNYRSEPSMNGVVEGQTGKGTFTIIDVSNGWGRLKSGVGWIWLGNTKYCTIGEMADESKPPKKFEPFKVVITADALNVRKGPGTNYTITGVVGKNDVYTIVDEDSNGTWGRLKSGVGWINLGYVRKM